MILLFVFLFSLKLITCAQLEVSNDDNVIEAIRENRNIIVLFTRKCDQQCKYEQSLASIREEFSSSFDGSVLRLESSQLQRVYDTQKRTSIVVFIRKGVGLLYEGADSPDSIFEYVSENREPIVRELDDSNFEHLTQASTGSTTGDWLIQFYDNQCIDCNRLSAVYETVGAHLKSRMNVARVNRGPKGIKTAKRFKVEKVPEFILLRAGKYYRYNIKNYETESFVGFATSWYNRITPEKVKSETTPFESLVELVVEQLKSLPSIERTFGDKSSLLIVIIGCFILLIFYTIFNRRSTKKDKNNEKAAPPKKYPNSKKAAKKEK